MFTRNTFWANTKYIHVNSSTLRTVYASSLLSKKYHFFKSSYGSCICETSFRKAAFFHLEHTACIEGSLGLTRCNRKTLSQIRLLEIVAQDWSKTKTEGRGEVTILVLISLMFDFQFFEKVLIFSIKISKLVAFF